MTITLGIALALNISDVLNANIYHGALETLYIYDDSSAFETDYITNFLKSANSPILYTFASKFAISADFNLVSFHKFLIIFCYLILLASLLLIGYRINGTIGALALSIIAFAQPIYSYQIDSASSHSFAYPLLMLGFACTLYGRTLSLALLTVFASTIYSPISVSLGLMLTWHALFTQRKLNLKSPQVRKTLAMLAVTGLIALMLLLQQLAPIQGFGDSLKPFEKMDSFPENGPDGRLHIAQIRPFAFVLFLAVEQFNSAFSQYWKAILLLTYLLLCLFGLGCLVVKRSWHRETIGFVIISISALVFIFLYDPFVSYRFILYPLFTILPVLSVIGILYFVNSYIKSHRFQAGIICIAMIIFLCTFKNTDSNRNIFAQRLDESANELMTFVKKLPSSSVLAAWPLDRQTSLIPYIAGRPLFINGRFHAIVNYEIPLLEMRSRMFSFLDGYFSVETKPLKNLHCKWNVDYLILDKTHFIGKENIPTYFEPFQSVIEERLESTPLAEMILSSPPEKWIVFSAGNFEVIDLSKTLDASLCAGH